MIVDRYHSRTSSGPDHFAQAATDLGAPPLMSADWDDVVVQKFLLPPGGWAHPEQPFIRVTIPLARPGRVRRRLRAESRNWVPGLKRQGMISITPPGSEGEWEWLDESNFGLLFLPQRLLLDVVGEAGLAGGKPTLRPAFAEPDEIIAPVFRSVADQANREGRLSRLLVSSAAFFLSMHIFKTYVAPGAAWRDSSGALDDLRLKRVIDAVEGDLGRDWSVDELAREAGLSPQWFAHTFKEKVGVSPRYFVQQRRLACAKRMLSGSSTSVAQIAAHCGFANQSWFTTCFKRAYAVTPAAYRRLVR